MWIGVWPPSKRTRLRAPLREPAPLWPRPDVLPMPEPWPRPTRLRSLRAPLLGPSEWRPIFSAIFDLHEVADRVDQPAHGRMVVALGGAADLAEAERAQRLALLAVGAVRRADLCDAQRRHQAEPSWAAGAASGVGPPLSRPSTWAIVRPRSSA